MHNAQRGSFVLEILVALALLLGIMGLATKTLLTQSAQLKSIKTREAMLERILIAEETILRAHRASAKYWGSTNVLISADRIDFREVDPRFYLKVVSRSRLSSARSYTLCGEIQLLGGQALEDLKTWLALTPDGNYTLRGTITKATGHPRLCHQTMFKGSFEVFPHSAFPPQCYFCDQPELLPHKEPLALIAILDEYSLFIDDKETLRMESRTKQINQPIVSGIARLSARPAPVPHISIVTLECQELQDGLTHELLLTTPYDPLIGLEMLP